jgi:hypothetical protein
VGHTCYENQISFVIYLCIPSGYWMTEVTTAAFE